MGGGAEARNHRSGCWQCRRRNHHHGRRGRGQGITAQDAGGTENHHGTERRGGNHRSGYWQCRRRKHHHGRRAEGVRILSAFFGLDNGVPGRAFGCSCSVSRMRCRLCDRESPTGFLDPSVFVDTRASGAVGCALAPADEAEGQDDPSPWEVASMVPSCWSRVVGTLATVVLMRRGSDQTVVPLAAGPPSWRNYLISELPTGAQMNALPIRMHHQNHVGRGRLECKNRPRRSHRLGTTVAYASDEVRVATLLADAFDNDNHVEFV